MYGDRGFRQKAAPVRVNDELEVTIEAVGKKGDGIAKKEGFVLFVPGGKKGEKLKVRITKVLSNVAFAESVGPAKAKESEDSSEEPDGDESGEDDSEEDEVDEESDEDSDDSEEETEDSENFGEEEKQ
ncbi:TRAM domain-containing protein [Candidatus Woesearchaeota archaeon]|nr:TRAM domain-containing protein [Candidatus Woesearchaeota archaeon]